MYVSMNGISVSYSQTSSSEIFMCSLSSFQIDNQIPGAHFPVLLMPRNNGPTDFFQLTAIKSRQVCSYLFIYYINLSLLFSLCFFSILQSNFSIISLFWFKKWIWILKKNGLIHSFYFWSQLSPLCLPRQTNFLKHSRQQLNPKMELEQTQTIMMKRKRCISQLFIYILLNWIWVMLQVPHMNVLKMLGKKKIVIVFIYLFIYLFNYLFYYYYLFFFSFILFSCFVLSCLFFSFLFFSLLF